MIKKITWSLLEVITDLVQVEKRRVIHSGNEQRRERCELNSVRALVTVVKGNISHLQPARVGVVVVCYSGVCCPLGLRARQCRCGSGGRREGGEEEGREGKGGGGRERRRRVGGG